LHTALSNEQTDTAVSAQSDSATVLLVFYDTLGVCIFADDKNRLHKLLTDAGIRLSAK
jgi:hypothetical protein